MARSPTADSRAEARSASLAWALACALFTASRRRPHTSGVQLAPSVAPKVFDGLAEALPPTVPERLPLPSKDTDGNSPARCSRTSAWACV
ncbi:hypothetical protein D3C72_2022150 [compost metagenome]